jgi:hypothetical protein
MKSKYGFIFAVVVAFHALAVLLSAQSILQTEYARIALKATAPSYKLGEPVIVEIILSNPTDHDLRYAYIRSSDQGDGYKFSVTSVSTSERLEKTDIGKQAYYEIFGGPPPPRLSPPPAVHQFFGLGGVSKTLKPHQTETFTTDLARTFNFAEPGTYRVEVETMPSDSPVSPITIVVTR